MTFQFSGRAVDYVESGEGPCIVFVPGSFSSTAAWRPISDNLKNFRSVATSLPGCGSTAPLDAENISVDAYVEIIEAVISRTNATVHLVGHSWGGALAVATALRKKAPLASLTLIEANPCDLLRQSGDNELYAAVKNMSEAYILAYQTASLKPRAA